MKLITLNTWGVLLVSAMATPWAQAETLLGPELDAAVTAIVQLGSGFQVAPPQQVLAKCVEGHATASSRESYRYVLKVVVTPKEDLQIWSYGLGVRSRISLGPKRNQLEPIWNFNPGCGTHFVSEIEKGVMIWHLNQLEVLPGYGHHLKSLVSQLGTFHSTAYTEDASEYAGFVELEFPFETGRNAFKQKLAEALSFAQNLQQLGLLNSQTTSSLQMNPTIGMAQDFSERVQDFWAKLRGQDRGGIAEATAHQITAAYTRYLKTFIKLGIAPSYSNVLAVHLELYPE